MKDPTRPQSGAVRDDTCLMWLHRPEHVCRSESGAPLDPGGGRCASWARIGLARRLAAGATPPADQAPLALPALALLAATYRLLAVAVPYLDMDSEVREAWSGAALAVLETDQALALAGWTGAAQSQAGSTGAAQSQAGSTGAAH